MAVKLQFDRNGNVICPNAILMTRGGSVIGTVSKSTVKFCDSFEDACEMHFSVYKEGCLRSIWEGLVNFRLIYIPEWEMLFEAEVETIDTPDSTLKNVICTALGYSELSQINVYGLEINTEDDIARDDYVATVLYSEDTSISLTHKLLDRAPHYHIGHVDTRIMSLQRMFSFDAKSILDCFKKVCEEVQCHLDIRCYIDSAGVIQREINLYDLLSYCEDCGERGDFIDTCSSCGGHNISSGCGDDTTVFVSKDNLGESVTYSEDVGSIKNCFRLSAGDDLMTATIANCNPNGSRYIWHISQKARNDMSISLQDKLAEYDKQYHYYNQDHVEDLDAGTVQKYIDIKKKYSQLSNGEVAEPDESICTIKGFQNLILNYYDTIDFELYLDSGLLPSFEMEDTTAEREIIKISQNKISVSVKDLDTCSTSSVDSAVLSIVKTIVHFYYKITIKESDYADGVWHGAFELENYGDADDKATSDTITISVDDDYENFTKQKLEKVLSKAESGTFDVSKLFDLAEESFEDEMRMYGLSNLRRLHDICQGCIDVLIQQGIGSETDSVVSSLYKDVYLPYYNKLTIIEKEMLLREDELNVVSDMKDHLLSSVSKIQKNLDFESFLGTELYCEFASYRRDDDYKNDNYISDGLDNTQLINNALDFLKEANKEIIKSSTNQHKIEANLTNLLAMKAFQPITRKFSVGNWIRVAVDNSVYKLRLLSYEIDFENPVDISTTFSDVTRWNDMASDIESVLSSASSMSSTYGAVTRQSKYGLASKNKIDNIEKNGIDVSNFHIGVKDDGGQAQTWDSHGFLCRRYDSDNREYDPRQLKLLNNGIVLTDDAWKSVRTALGEYQYENPITHKVETMYGINAELLIGKLILGENLFIQNKNGSMSFDSDGGLSVSNGTNKFSVDPNSDKLVRLTSLGKDLLYVDNAGRLFISCDGSDIDISANKKIVDVNTNIRTNAKNIAKNAESIEALKDYVSIVEKDVKQNTLLISDAYTEFESIMSILNSIEERLSALEATEETK